MQKIEIYFDGYCPESLLKGKYAEMKLNEDDFWESEATGLQLAVFPPYATILRWRGNGKLRPGSKIASDTITGLIMAKAQLDEGMEIYPDEKNLITNNFELDLYIGGISKNRKAYDAEKFNSNAPELEDQRLYLESLPKDDFKPLLQLFHQFKDVEFDTVRDIDGSFQKLHYSLYDLKLIFNFKWMDWHNGLENMNDPTFDYSKSSLLDLSMYLTAIFRADRFCEGNIELNFQDGTLEKIFTSIESLINTTSLAK